MDFPLNLKATIEEKCAQIGLAELTRAARSISERYRTESGHGKRLLTEDVEALSYAAVRMPATYGAVSAALSHTLACFNAPIASVLDVGAGTGAATWAIREQLAGEISFTCLERESAMIRLGASLMATDESLSQAAWIQHDLSAKPITQAADLVVASYALNELDYAKRTQVLRDLWAHTERLLLLIEPGTPVGFAQLRQARQELLSLGGQMVAPCPHAGECPLPADDWCHFTSRVARSRLHKQLKGGDAPYEDEKFAFLAIAKAAASPAPTRILRHPLKEAGRITLRLCTPQGVVDQAVMKKHGDLFKQARKAGSGDAFPAI